VYGGVGVGEVRSLAGWYCCDGQRRKDSSCSGAVREALVVTGSREGEQQREVGLQ